MPTADDATSWTFVEFGTQLRRRRRSDDLTQQALARAAKCSEHTIKKLEQGLRRPSPQMAASLADALRLTDDERTAFMRAGTGGTETDPNAIGAVGPLTTILGAETMTVHCWDALVGRSRELTDVPAQLQRSRLVTLCGPGGVGKSRLAAEIARRDDSGPTLWVEFKHLDGDASVDANVARSLRVGQSSAPLRQRVIARLGTDDWLVVLDNCEGHTVEVADWCSTVLDACPFVRVLLTSRVVTYLPGEARWPLRGLSTNAATDPGHPSFPSDAVALFVERASAAALQSGTFARSLDPTALAAISSICERLDGLPLAIELAAGRADLYPPATLAERLSQDQRFLQLGGALDEPRYTNLDDMVMWSYELLDDVERRCLRAVSIFRGSFEVGAAHAVSGKEQPLHGFEQTFARLVGSSLISRSSDDASTFHVLETIRATVAGMQSPSEADRLARRHAEYFAQQAELAEPKMWGNTLAVTLSNLARHQADFSAAVESSCARGDAATARRITGALFRYWDIRGHIAEGLALCRLADTADGVSSAEIDARSANALGTLPLFSGDGEMAVSALERAAELAQAFGIGHELAHALVHLGFCAEFADDSASATRILHETIAVARHYDERALEGWAHILIVAEHVRHERFDAVDEPLTRALTLLTGVDQEGVAWALAGQAARSVLSAGDTQLSDVEGALQACIELRSGWGISVVGLLAGICAVRRDQPDLAAELLTASDQLLALIGSTHLPMMNEWRATLIDSVRAAGQSNGDEIELDGDPLEVIHTIDTLVDRLLGSSTNRSRPDAASAGAS